VVGRKNCSVVRKTIAQRKKAEALEEMAVPGRLHYTEEFTRLNDRRQRKIRFRRKRLRSP
jgi:hypothetical protein